MVNINSKSQARRRVREAQIKANEARIERERQNVDDAASLLVELGRLAAVDQWEHNRNVEIRAEGERRRHEHRQAGAAAVARMQGRGETFAAIAELAGVKVGEIRAVLRAAGAHSTAASDALGSVSGAAPVADGAASGDGADNGSAVNGVAAQALGGDAARTDGVGEFI